MSERDNGRTLREKASLAASGAASVAMLPVYINQVAAPYTYSTDDRIDIDVSRVSISTLGGNFFMTAIFSMDTGGL